MVKQRLITERVLPDSYRDQPDIALRAYLEAILPYVIQHGVDEGVRHFERDMRELENEGDEDGD